MSATNVGELAISLDIEVSSRLQDQINKVSNGVADKLKANIEKSVTKSDLSKTIGKSMSGVIKKASDIGSKIGQSIESKIKASMERSKASIDKTVTKASTMTDSQAVSGPASSGKGLKGVPKEFLVSKRDSSMQMQDNVNAQIEQLAQKMKELRNLNIDGSKSEEMLKIEARMISLTDKSDKLTLDIRQLDAAIDGFDANEINSQGGKAAETIDRIDKAAKKATGSMKGLGSGSTKAQRPLINMRSIGASLARNFLGLQLLITLVGQAVRKMAQAFWNALNTNDKFRSSLDQIKSNLATAFQPIFQAIMPAINALMAGLAKATAYLAAFTSMLFGKSVKAMNASAKAMSKANKEASRMVAGFDQLNDITESGSDSASGSISPVNIDEAEIGKIKSFMDKVKGVFDSSFGALLDRVAQRSSELFAKVLPSLQTGIDNAKTLFTNVFTDVQSAAAEFFPKLIEQYQAFIDNLFITFGPAIEFLVNLWEDLSQIMLDVWNKYGKKIVDGVAEFIVGMVRLFNLIWTEIIDPILRPAFEMLQKLWDEHIKDVVMKVADFIGYFISEAFRFYNKFIQPIIEWLVKKLGPVFKQVFDFIYDKVGKTLGTLFDTVGRVIDKVKGAFSGLITFLEGVFTGNWSKVFEGLGQIIKNVFGGIVEFIKPAINAIIDGINGFISSVNRIKVPSWVPFVGGKTLSIPTIPRLANGGVLKEPTLNIAGEYPGASSNPEIVSPQNILADTFRSVLREFMDELRGNGQMSEQSMNLVVNIGGRKLLSELIKLADEFKKQTGKEITFNV